VWTTYLNRVEESLDQTLADLGTDHLDRKYTILSLGDLILTFYAVLLIHWPIHSNPSGNHPLFPLLPDGTRDVVRDWNLSTTWAEMEGLVKKGKVRSIGVSNFSQMKLEEILPTATIVPAINQLELHIYNPQKNLLKYMAEKGIKAQAYSPLGSTGSPLTKDEVVVEIAKNKGVDPSAVCLAYLRK
jgi:glycerol 2-dehydrogenase (NADP+)